MAPMKGQPDRIGTDAAPCPAESRRQRDKTLTLLSSQWSDVAQGRPFILLNQ